MGSVSPVTAKPHAVCVPYPAQGHINPMFMLAKVLHSKGFHITFVNNEYNHQRLLKSHGLSSLANIPDFDFKAIPDGLPSSGQDGTQDIPSLCQAVKTNFLQPFRDLLNSLNTSTDTPPVSCIVSDSAMDFPLDAAEEMGIPVVLLYTMSVIGIMCLFHFQELVERGITPVRDMADLTKEYLETPIEGIPAMPNLRLRDLPTFWRTADPHDSLLELSLTTAGRASRVTAAIFNTFEELEAPVLQALVPLQPSGYAVGPLSLLVKLLGDSPASELSSSLWKEDASCLEWLEGRKPGSVVYVNFGSITVVTNEQLVEFAWGLAHSKRDFLWIIRPDLVKGDTAVLPEEFLKEIQGRGKLASWCSQEKVLEHSAVGGFLTHSGWNSTLESICAGVPMLCWPFFAEQQTNCRYACSEWGIGMEIDGDVKREEVRSLIEDLMDGERGKEMRRRARELKDRAADAVKPGGISSLNIDNLVRKLLTAATRAANP